MLAKVRPRYAAVYPPGVRQASAAGGRLILVAEGSVIGRAAVRGLRQFVGRQKETAPVVADMRRDGRY